MCYIQRHTEREILWSSTISVSPKDTLKLFMFVIWDTKMLDFHLVHDNSHISE